jgi:hypothetical protein
MGQDSLIPVSRDASAEIYRFTLIPSFDRPWPVVLQQVNESYRITNVEVARRRGFPPGMPAADQGTKEIDLSKVIEFQRLFEEAAFFTQRALSPEGGLDGETWILEAVRAGEYHGVLRWAPTYETQRRGLEGFVACCQWLKDHAPL